MRLIPALPLGIPLPGVLSPRFLIPIALLFAAPIASQADIFAQLRGVVHDPQHRPIADAEVTLRAAHSALTFTMRTGADGAFTLSSVPLGDYTVTAAAPNFAPLTEPLTLASATTSVLHLELALPTLEQTATVTHSPIPADTSSVTTTTLISRDEIAQTPGADRSNSLAMITAFVPGAYVTHDMLHLRGGHQVSWLLDGVPIPNTDIASNLGAQIDPKDIDYLAVDRGSYTADLGDRTFGVFNVVPRSGFERDRSAELVVSMGSFLQTNDQISLGDHTQRFAWYASANGNRSDYGLSTPIPQILHDTASGFGGFSSLVFNRSAADQLRLVAQLRTDHFQIPYDPNPDDFENQQYDSSGLRDHQHETDGLAAFTWLHSLSPNTVLHLSPFVHANQADYDPSPADTPVASTAHRASTYAGGQASLSAEIARNSIDSGLYSFGEHESSLFAATFNDGSGAAPFRTPASAAGGVIEEWLSDTVQPTPWLTLIGGLRATQIRGMLDETAIAPRAGISFRLPRLHWVARAFYGQFYQPPPLLTATGPLVQLAQANDTSFQPLRGERDEEHQFGLAIPYRGWVLDADTFRIHIRNFLDHANIGDSSLFFPVTVQGGLVRAWELTLRSPRIAPVGELHLAYSNQIAEQRGAITGGLICTPVASAQCDVEPGYSPVDHDQRNTLALGGSATLPWRTLATAQISYGSGFVNGSPDQTTPYPNPYLPSHTTVDISLAHTFTDDLSASISATNLADQRVLLDNSLTFGGFHFSDPREIFAEVRYRFHF